MSISVNFVKNLKNDCVLCHRVYWGKWSNFGQKVGVVPLSTVVAVIVFALMNTSIIIVIPSYRGICNMAAWG